MTSTTPSGDYAISVEKLSSLTRDHNISTLQEYNGVSRLRTYISSSIYLFLNIFSCIILISTIMHLTVIQVKGLSAVLKTNIDKGIDEDETDLFKRRTAFGSNTYPRKKGRSFLVCVFFN